MKTISRGALLMGLLLPLFLPAEAIKAAPVQLDISQVTVVDRQDIADIQAQIEMYGVAPVLISLDLPFTPDGALGDRERRSQRERIGVLQGQVLKALALSDDAPGVTAFRYIPAMALKVTPAQLEGLSRLPQVKRIQLDGLGKAGMNASLPQIGADETKAAEMGGAGQTIAMIDTGFLTSHDDLVGKVIDEVCLSNVECGGVTTCPNGHTFQHGPDSAPPVPGFGSNTDHGTHTSSIAAGRRGVAPEADLAVIQVFTRFNSDGVCGSGQSPCLMYYYSDLIRGLEHAYWLVDTQGIDLTAVNMSLGSDPQTSPSQCDTKFAGYFQAVENLRSKDVLSISIAGNGGQTSALESPGCLSNVISVGNVTGTDSVFSLSNSAPFLDFLAPGTNINAAGADGGSVTWSGTSMSAPHVTGAFAALKAAHGDRTEDEIIQVLRDTGKPVTDPKSGVTTPRIQMDAAVEALRGEVRLSYGELGKVITVGDYNGNGMDDLFVGHYSASVYGFAQAGMGVSFFDGPNGELQDDPVVSWPSEMEVFPNQSMQMGRGLATADFNKDGRDDRVVGFSGGDAGGAYNAGFACIGVSEADGSMMWGDCFNQGGGSPAESWDRFGDTIAVGDFDCDSLLDVAVGASNEDWGNGSGATNQVGVVMVFSGNGDGTLDLSSDPLLIKQNSFGDPMRAGDRFGSALAAGDMNHDGCDDLIVGTGQNDTDNVLDTGHVLIAHGHPTGVGQVSWEAYLPSDFGIGNDLGARLGHALAVGDFNGDKRDDLAIGAPGVDVDGKSGAGAVFILEGGKSGLGYNGLNFTHMDGAQPGNQDKLGWALATGRVDDTDLTDELIIGAPFKDLNGLEDVGQVHVLFGGAIGLSTSGMVTLNPADVASQNQKRVRFGHSVEVGRFSGKGGVAIGAPGMDSYQLVDNGGVCIYTHQHQVPAYCVGND